MKTASLECQIAREQLKKYLGGSKLSPELVRGLERHLASCPECLAMARNGRQPQAAKPTGKPAAKPAAKSKKMPGFALVDNAKAAVSKPLADKKKANTRTMVLGGLLVLTLGAMGAISRNPEGMLGKRAIVAEAASKKVSDPAPVVKPAAKDYAPEPMKGEPMPMAPIEVPVVETPSEAAASNAAPVEKAPVSKPKVTASAEPKKTVSRPVNRRPIRRSAPRNTAPAKPKSDSGSIRVYDASGRPVNPN